MSGRDKYIRNDLDNDVRRILNVDSTIKGKGIEKIIIPSNIIDIFTRLEILLGLKLSGHSDTLTDASNLIDELYKRGEIQKNSNIEMLSTSYHKYIPTNVLVFISRYTYKYKPDYSYKYI